MRVGAERIATGFARAGGAPAAADKLESLIDRPHTPARTRRRHARLTPEIDEDHN